MAYEIPYDSDYQYWYGIPQNVTRLSAVLQQTTDEDGNGIGRIAASWDMPDNGGTFVAQVSADGENYTIAETDIRQNSAVLTVLPNTSYYLKIVTVLGTNQSDGTVSELLQADEIPTPNTPQITVRESGLIIDVGIIPQGYTASIVIDNGVEAYEVETSKPTYTYLCDPDDYEISVAFMDANGNVGEYTEIVPVTVEEVYVRKTSHYYIKRAEVNGSALMLTTGDNQTIIFQGGGGIPEPIVQDDDTVILPTGYMDGIIRQQMLTVLFKPSRMLILS